MTTSDSADKELAVPRSGWADRVRTLLLGGVGIVPFAGSAASALVEVLWRPAYEKRVETFLDMVVAELNKLDDRIDNLEELLQRDVAISVGLAAGAAAGKTHDQTKLRYLANAVVRVTIDTGWDEQADFALLMLQLVDDLTVTHVRVLTFFTDTRPWVERFTRDAQGALTFDHMFGEAFPGQETAMIRGIFHDLIARNLVPYQGADPAPPPVSQGPSPLGRALLDFIKPAVPAWSAS